MSGSTGARYERRLRNALEENGYRCMRSPSSGSGTTHPQPDLLARNRERTLCIELKYQKDPRIYLAEDEIDQLLAFAEPWPDALAMIVARWKGDTNYYAIPVQADVVVRTDAGRYRVKHEEVVEASQRPASEVFVLTSA